MPELVKDILKPGLYQKKTAQGVELVRVTDADLNNWIAGFKAMEAADLRLSIPREHPPLGHADGMPVDWTDQGARSVREKSQTDAGFLADVFKDAAGTLQGKFIIRDEKEAADLQKDGVRVSPAFSQTVWTDRHGRKWNKPLLHVALTHNPVNKGQTKNWDRVVSMSDLPDEPGIVALSIAEMADYEPPAPKDDKPADPPAPKSTEETVDPAKYQESMQQMAALKAAFQPLCVVLPEKFSLSGDIDVLIAALQSAAAAKNQAKAEQQPKPEDPAAGVQSEKSTIAMSETPKPAEVQLSETEKSLIARITASDRKEYTGRIDAAFNSGRCTKPQAEKLREVAGQYQFSTGPTAPSVLDAQLELIEGLPKGCCWTPEQQIQEMSVSEERRNKGFWDGSGEPSDEAIDKAIAELHPQLAT